MAPGRAQATVADAQAAIERLAPPELAAPWDRVGLRWGRRSAPVRRILLTVDLTAAVLAEATAGGCQLVVAYHPPLWEPRPQQPLDPLAQAAIAASVAVYSPHTAWDAAPGGANDQLADLLGLRGRRALEPARRGGDLLLRFTAPPDAVEAICQGLEAAGCGELGAYRGCSFRVAGVGTFAPQAGARPHIGAVGERCRVDEQQVELRLPPARRAAAIAALRAHHPYEEPAFVVLASEPAADPAVGMGRVGEGEGDLAAHLARLRQGLGLRHLLLALPPGATGAWRPGRVAVAVGAGGGLVQRAAEAGAGLLVTGELDHHRTLAAVAGGMAVVATLHSHAERSSLAALAARLRDAAELAGVELAAAAADADPWQVV